MDHRDNDWFEKLIRDQDEYEKDVNLGPAHLEKTISKKQQESFLPQKEIGVNNRRKDSGTKATESRQHKYKRDDIKLETEFKRKRERVFEQQEMEAESMPEAIFEKEIEYQREADYDQSEAAEDARDGLREFRDLAGGGSHFTFKEDDKRFDDYPEPTAEELKQIEVQERQQRDEDRKNRDFRESQTYGGKRIGKQGARVMR